VVEWWLSSIDEQSEEHCTAAMDVTKEEMLWSSFRLAVGDLQRSLRGELAARASPKMRAEVTEVSTRRGSNVPRAKAKPPRKDTGIATIKESTGDQSRCSSAAGEDVSQLSSPRSDQSATMTTRKPRLELTGMEEVNRNAKVRSMADAGGIGGNVISPLNNAPSHASQTTAQLSMAEQQLAETKLKLAMTEEERDELEFRLLNQKPIGV